MQDTVVVLLHGIRTSGAWQSRVKHIFEMETKATVIPVKYGYFDIFRFLIPSESIRGGPVAKVRRELQQVLKDHPGRKVIVFAHSFGTYVISRILSEEGDIHIDRLVLCGGVVDPKFDWLRFGKQVNGYISGGDRIINECGTLDIWPVLAQSLTFGFGASGTFGMGTGGVRDRYHPLRHSGFFEEEFIRRYWLPVLRDEETEPTTVDAKGASHPWYFWLLRAPLKLPLLLLAVIFFLLGAAFFAPEVDITPEELAELVAAKTQNEQTRAELAQVTGELQFTHGQITTFLSLLLAKNIPEADWAKELITAKQAFDQAQVELERLRKLTADTPEIQAQLDQAQMALATGDQFDLDAAQIALRDARQTYETQIMARRHEENRVMLSLLTTEAELAEAKFERQMAAGLWLKAAGYEEGGPRVVILERAGQAALIAGDLHIAELAFRDVGDTSKRMLNGVSDDPEWQHNLVVSHSKLGDIALARGDLAGAERAYLAGLEIAKHLAETEPDNAQWQRNLSVSYNKQGDIARERDDLEGAERAYRLGLEIAQRLVDHDPENREWQRDLAISHERLGEIFRARGDLEGADRAYRARHEIAQRLAEGAPGSTVMQRDVVVSYIKLGDIALARRDLIGAEVNYRAGLEIARRLVQRERDNSELLRSLSVSYVKMGDVARSRGDLVEAERAYHSGLEITQRLVKAEPGNSQWQRDLFMSFAKLAVVDAAHASQYLQQAISIASALEKEGKLDTTDAKILTIMNDTMRKLKGE